MLCRAKNKEITRVMPLLFIIILLGIILVGLYSENAFIARVFDTSQPLSSRLNRVTNWDAAISRIQDTPLLGHGLGGYYIDNDSLPGSGTYAHNLVLELLSETGFFGAIIILVPVVLFFIIGQIRHIRMFRTAGGGSLVPLLVMDFAHAMISHDIRTSYVLFAVTAVLWAHTRDCTKTFVSRQSTKHL